MRYLLRVSAAAIITAFAIGTAHAQVQAPPPQVQVRPPLNPNAVKVAANAVKEADTKVNMVCVDANPVILDRSAPVIHCLSNGVDHIWMMAPLESEAMPQEKAKVGANVAAMLQAIITFATVKSANPGSPLKLQLIGRDGFIPLITKVQIFH